MATKKQTKAAECKTSPGDGVTLDEVSPYTGSICEIYFKNQQPFRIHRDFIRGHPKLDGVCGDSNGIYIKDVPDEAGHVLVNYLYTGTWQVIRKRHSPRDSITSTNLETSVHVYAVAQAYGLPDDDSWFLAFTMMRMKHLFKEPATLNEPVLLECFRGDTPFSKILTKSLVRICCENPFSIKTAKSCALSPPEPPTVPETEESTSTDSLQTPDSVLEPSPAFTLEMETVAMTEVSNCAIGEYVEEELAQKQEAVTKSKPEALEVEDDPFASLSKLQKKKKKAELAAAAAAATAVADICADNTAPETLTEEAKSNEPQETICVEKTTHIVYGG